MDLPTCKGVCSFIFFDLRAIVLIFRSSVGLLRLRTFGFSDIDCQRFTDELADKDSYMPPLGARICVDLPRFLSRNFID